MVNVFHNLLENAIKYCERAPLIRINAVSEGKKIVIRFADNGIGISNENLKRIFHRFYRVPTGNVHNVKGFGIGLHYVKLVVEAHQGEVTVSSVSGEGSVFEIKLPEA